MGQRIAIVIGVGSSPQSQNPFLKPLTAPPHVARDLAAQLQSPTSNFTIPAGGLLVEEAATAPAIQDALLDATASLGSDDLLLIAFCGHGMRLPLDSGITDVVLATYDYHQPRALRSPERYVTTRWLRDTILKSPHVGQIVLLLDCCYAGTINESADDPKIAELRAELSHLLDISKTDTPTHTSPGRTPITRLAISAALPRRTAGAKEHTTLFSAALLKGLRGDLGALRADGTVTVASVREFIRQELGDQQMASQAGIDAEVVVLATHASPVAQSAAQVHQTLIAEQVSRDRLRIEAAANHVESTRLLQLRRQGFVGRVAERAAIQELIEQMRPTGGYVLVKGLAGEGKSSMLAALIDEAGVTTTPHHFIALTAGRDYQLGLLRALIAQLILKHDLSLSYFPEDSYPAMRDYFAVVLKQLADTGATETMYLDGLDQLPIELDGRRDLSFLPPQPPPGIVIVLGTRPDDTLKPLEPLHRCDYPLPHLSLPDFEALLRDRTPDLQLPALTVERLYQALDRNALYLALASNELQRTPTADVATLVQTITANPGNLFQLTLDRLKQQDRLLWDRVIKPALAVLVVAQEPLTQPMLRSILKVDHDDLRDALDRLGGLVGQSADGRHFLYHLKLREFLHEPLTGAPDRPFLFPQDVIQTWHHQLATWCLPTNEAVVTIWDDTTGVEQERRWYARHHALTHLTDSQQWERLWAIIDDGRYGEAKCRFDPSTHLYALDLDLARAGAATLGNLTQLWRLSLLRVTLASRVDQWPDEFFTTMILLGQQAEALRRVEVLPDPIRKTRILCQIAPLVRLSETKLIWERARAIANTIIDDTKRDQVLYDLAAALINTGQFDAAHIAADTIIDDRKRAPALYGLAAALTAAGQFNTARIIADAISNDEWRAAALLDTTRVLADVGQFDAAGTTVAAMANGQDRVVALCALAVAQANADQVNAANITVIDARSTADTILDNKQRTFALGVLAASLSRIGQTTNAHETFAVARIAADTITETKEHVEALGILAGLLARADHSDEAHVTFTESRSIALSISNKGERTTALQGLAIEQAQAGYHQEARTTIDMIPDLKTHIQTLGDLGIAQAHASLHDDAQTTFTDARIAANTISKEFDRDNLLYDLTTKQIQANYYQDAIITATVITEDWKRTQAFNDIVTAQSTAGQFDAARTTADTISDHIDHVKALRVIATAQATAGQFDAARTTTNAITEDKQRVQTLSIIAATQATTGFLDAAHSTFTEARAIPMRIGTNWLCSNALVTITTNLAKANQFNTALTAVDAITDSGLRVKAFVTIATDLIAAGYRDKAHIAFRNARTNADDITNDEEHSQALTQIATALAKANQFDTARVTVDAITNDRSRAQTLSVIATTLIAAGHSDEARATFINAHTIADAISNNEERTKALKTLAASLAKTRQFEAARITADAISDEWDHGEILKKIAILQATAGHFDAACTTADAITTWRRNEALMAIATAQAIAGHFDAAHATVNNITDDYFNAERERNAALSALAVSQAIAGHFDAARTTINTISNNDQQTQALTTLAIALTNAGHPIEAHTIFNTAHATANNITRATERASALSTLAMALLHTHNPKEALTILIPLYREALRQDQTAVAPSWPGSSIYAMAQGLTHSSLRPAKIPEVANGHLQLIQYLYHIDREEEAKAILAMAWQFATTTLALFRVLPWITPWIAQDPTLLPAILDSIAWVDQQLAAMA